MIDYTFQVGFPHDLTNEELIKKRIAPAIEKLYEKYKDTLPKKARVLSREEGFNLLRHSTRAHAKHSKQLRRSSNPEGLAATKRALYETL